MRLRVALHHDSRHAADTSDPGASLAALLAQGELAEEVGLDMIWVGECPTEPGGFVPAALPVCAALAARTTRLGIGSAVLPLALHDPLRIAEDAASLDTISAGRFELGLGLGFDPAAGVGFGVAAGDRTARLEEAIVLLRSAWAGPLSHAGPHFPVEGVEVWPRPVQPGGPPLWIGAGAPDAQRRAARLGTGLFLTAGVGPEPFLDAWREADRPDADLRLAVPISALPGAAGETSPTRRSAEVLLAEARQWIDALPGVAQIDLVFPAQASGPTPSQRPGALHRLGEMAQRLRASVA